MAESWPLRLASRPKPFSADSRMWLLLGLLCLALQPVANAYAETMTFVCAYDRFTDDERGLRPISPPFALTFVVDVDRDTAYVIGNNGSAAVTVTPGDLMFTFTEVTKGGSVQTTSIGTSGTSVHSRHTAYKGNLIPSQYYGRCAVQ